MSRGDDPKYAFILDETLLRSWWQEFERVEPTPGNVPAYANPQITANVSFTKGSFSTSSLEEILALDNSGERTISSISISSSSYADPRISVSFYSRTHSAPIKYTASGDPNGVTISVDNFSRLAERSRAWYSKLAFVDMTKVVLLVYTVAWASLFAYAVAFTDVNVRFEDSGGGFTLGLLLGLVLMAIGYALERVKSWFFPIALFVIGDGAKVVKRYETRRQVLYVGVFIAFVVGIASSLATGFIA